MNNPISLSEFIFIPDVSSPVSCAQGDGDVLLPPGAVPDDVQSFEVVDRTARRVVFEGGGRTYLGGVLLGRSFWESDETWVFGTACVNVLVLDPSYDVTSYPVPRHPMQRAAFLPASKTWSE